MFLVLRFFANLGHDVPGAMRCRSRWSCWTECCQSLTIWRTVSQPKPLMLTTCYIPVCQNLNPKTFACQTFIETHFCCHIKQVEYFRILIAFNTSYICNILQPFKLFKIHYPFIRTDDKSEDLHLVISKPKPTNMNL